MLALRRYLGALSVAIAAYAAYALLAAPWLEPRISRAAASGRYTPEMPVDDSYRALFQPPAWELDNPKIVETAQCTLLLKDYQPLPDGRMEINPCTLIFYAAPGESADGKSLPFARRRPIVLRAPEGAVLQFDRPIDVGRATVGRLMEGTLRGKIHIFSPPSRPGANDALDLTTRNVKIDREKVYTPSAVDFRYGRSFGRGHDLTITLLPEDKEQPGGAASLGGLSVLQLARIERLHLEGNAEGLMPAAGSSAVNPAAVNPSAKEMPLEVRCEGPLVVDFEQNLAALDEQVEISRVYPQGPPDRMTCDRLIFHLVERGKERGKTKSGTKGAKSATGPSAGPQFSELIERAIAVGSPVVLDAPQAGTFAKADRFEYLSASKRISLKGGKSSPQVTLRYHQSEFEAPEIEYEMAEPGRLGRLWSAGPGKLKFVPLAGQKGEPIEAAWQSELTIIPDGKNKVVSLKGEPLIRLDQGSFSAHNLVGGAHAPGAIHLWVLEVPANREADYKPNSTSPATIRQPAVDKSPAAPKYLILPDRMLATGQVEIDSPQLAAHTSELRAWFVHQSPPAAAPRSGPTFDPAPQPRPRADDKPRVQKLDVSGALIQLQVLRRGDESLVENLAITGGVKVREQIDEYAESAALELVGDAVTLRQWSTSQAALEIHGRPAAGDHPAENARVSARGLSLSGPTIHLHRADNRLWIPGAGEAVLPIPEEMPLVPPVGGALRGPLPPPAAATGSQPSRPLKVSWQGSFEFDGQKGIFSGDVQARGENEVAAGDELTVTLSERIDFAAARQPGEVELAHLRLAGSERDVTMQRVLKDERGQMVAHENGRVRDLEIDRTTGRIHATGPGEVWTVRRDLKLGGGLVPAARAAAEQEPALSYVCVSFRREITGDLNRREITFHQDVDTIYGQVRQYNSRVAATRAEDLGESGVHVLSDTLKVTEMAMGDVKWIELQAAGRTRAEGLKFYAQSDRISYTSDKDQLVISSDGRSPAELWLRKDPQDPGSHMAARRFVYQRSNNSFQMDDGQMVRIDISRLPKSDKPAPKLR